MLISHDDQKVTVSAYSDELKPIKNILVATVATLYQDGATGDSYILIIHQALYFGERLESSLLNPNQLRSNGLIVDEVPRQFDCSSTHSIMSSKHNLRIPLKLEGVISGFETRKPTWAEFNDSDIPHVELTADEPWLPSSGDFAEKERLVASVSKANELDSDAALHRQISCAIAYQQSQEALEQLDDDLHKLAQSTVVVSSLDHYGDGLIDREDRILMSKDPEVRTVSAMSAKERKSTLTPEILARRWHIGLAAAKRTMIATTQTGLRNVLAPGERRIRQRMSHLKYPTLRGRFYTDTMFAKVKSLRGSKAAQVYTDGHGYDRFYPIATKREVPQTLVSLIHDVGIPQEIVSDNAGEEVHGDFQKSCRHYHIRQKQTVPYSPWSNAAEASIRELKTGIRRAMRRTNTPRRLWCYCGQWVAAIRRLTALDIHVLQGRVPDECVTGYTPDISPYAQFDWYAPVYYWDPANNFPHERKVLGRWVGVAEAAIDVMAFNILTSSGRVVVRKDVWSLTDDEKAMPEIQASLKSLDDAIQERIGDALKEGDVDPELLEDLPVAPPELFDDDDEDIIPFDPEAVKQEADDYTPESYDEYITAQVMLPHGGEMQMAKVRKRTRDLDGLPMGRRNPNPLLDTRSYEVEFPDGSTEAVNANTIAENIFSQVDQEGRSYAILKEITDHRKDGNAITKDESTFVDRNGKTQTRMTTRGWDMQVEWKDGTSSWIPLKDLKESNPVEVAEYAVANQIAEEPAFTWWVRQVLRRRDRIVGKVKSRYWVRTHKFGIELPKSVKEALAIDERNSNDFWRKAIEKEMKNVSVAFEFRDDDIVPKFYKKIDCHMIFDVKMDLTRKARLVAGGHQTEAPPKETTFSSVVSRDSVRIAFTIAALNDLSILAADVQNAYLNAPTKEKVYTIAGLEFGPENVGRPVLIVRALYGLRSSGARWRDHMAATIREAGFKNCLADPDVWMRPAVKPNGDKYWEYILCYVDDVLVVSMDPNSIMDHLRQHYTLKEGSVHEPDIYLGAEIKKWTIDGADNPAKARWAMSSDSYVRRSIADVEQELAQIDQRLPTKVTTPLSSGYRPELDTSPELDAKRANYYQGLIGVLRWMCELGRVDILHPVALMSRYLANPRRGHLEQLFHMFGYLKRYSRSSLVFDETEPEFDESRFIKCDWTEYYPDAQEAIPPNAPEPRGMAIRTSSFVDADHAGCHVTRRSHTGVLIYLNRAPILWYSKRQNTVEASTFGSEFVAMKIAVELIEGLRYKLRMMGIPLEEPTNVFCDNEAVVKNSTKPESTLKKKHNAIAYHRVREAQAAGIVRIAKEDGLTNLADIFTKLLAGPKLRELAGKILW